MRKTVQHMAKLFSRLFGYGASLSMLMLFLIVFINSVRRYTFGKSLEWGEQLPVFIAIYGVMFGVAWAYMQDRHIRFTILVGFLPDHLTRKLYLFVDMLMVFTGGLLAYSGWLFVSKRGGLEASGLINMAKDLRAATGWDPMIWIGHFYPYQAAIMIGGGMIAIAALLRFSLRLYDDAVPVTAWNH